MATVLIIDDNPAVLTALSILMELNDIEAQTATSPGEGLDLLRNGGIAAVIQDMNFAADTTSGLEGGELFGRIRAHDPEMPVILLTAWTHLEQAVELVRAGAADYLEKPWNDDKLLTTLRNLLELASARQERRELLDNRDKERLALQQRADLCGLIYESLALHDLVSTAVRIAPTDVPVLITGPNGSGKEKIAEIIHCNPL